MIIKTVPLKAIYDYLGRNPIVNENIIGIMENEAEAEIYVDDEDSPKGVLVRYRYFNYIYTEDDNFLEEVFQTVFSEGFYGFSGIYRPLAEKIRQRYLVNWEGRCALYYLPEGKFDSSLIRNTVRSIDTKDAETVNEFYIYKNHGSLERIKEDIKHRPSSAIYVDGEPVCWVLVHNDNSMGIMYTKEEHRGKGYAVDVTMDLAGKIRKQGKTPYLQIREENSMSPGLAAKCGFEKIGFADWFGIIVGIPQEIIDGGNQGRYALLQTLGEVKELMDVKLLYTGVKGYDLVYDIKLEDDNLVSRVDEVLEECSKLAGDFIWEIDSRNDPEKLINALEEQGLRRFKVKNCMHLPIDLFKSDNCSIEGFAVEEVKGVEGIELWCDILSSELEGREKKAFQDMMLRAMTKKDNKYELYLGRINGRAVSTSAIMQFDCDSWGISFVTVAPYMKDTQLFKSAIIETIKKSQRPELGWVTMQVSQELVGIMEEIGFIHSHYLRSYRRE
jgi:hypothetical protein